VIHYTRTRFYGVHLTLYITIRTWYTALVFLCQLALCGEYCSKHTAYGLIDILMALRLPCQVCTRLCTSYNI